MDPRLIALMQMAQRAKQPVRRFDDGGEVFDLGSFDDLAAVDFGDMDFGGGDFNVGDFDASSFDIGDLSALLGDLTGGGDAGETIDMLTRGGAGEDVNIEDLDLNRLARIGDIGGFGAYDPAFIPMGDNRLSPVDQFNAIMKDLAFSEGRLSSDQYNRMFPIGSTEASKYQAAAEDLMRDAELGRFAAPGYGDLGQFLGGTGGGYSASGGTDLGSFEDLAASEQQSKLQDLFGSSIQDLGAKGTLTDEGLLQIGGYDRPGGMTSQWQTTPSGERVFLHDESGYYKGQPVDQTGTAIKLNPDGTIASTRALTTSQIQDMIKKGELNTAKSGYFSATGGSKIAPGGGIVTTKDGQTVVLKPDGKIYNVDTGKTITDTKTIKEIIDQIRNTGGTGGVSTRPGVQQSNLASLLPLLLMMLMMNRQSGGTSSATIPALSASQTQTPYGAIQQAAGYRPGQGGITYFNPIQYAPKMAGGGIADLAMMKQGGRLLHGPGDGVSDSIPATIGGQQPARLARGEYVIDARTVAELGNGSTDAGAERLDEMRQRVLSKRKQAKMGQDTRAYKHLPA